MEWCTIRARLQNRMTKEQKAALTGKIPMTKEKFLECLIMCWKRQDMKMFWKVWNKYPDCVKAFHAEFEQNMSDRNPQEVEAWLTTVKPKLTVYFGEEWIKENCIE